MEFSRPLRPKWSGTAGLTFQHAGAHDEKGNSIIKDHYSSPLTASGKTHDDVCWLNLKVFTLVWVIMAFQCLFSAWSKDFLLSEWLVFNRVNARAREGIQIGLAVFFLACLVVTWLGISLLVKHLPSVEQIA